MSGVRLVLPYPISANRYWRMVATKNGARLIVTEEAKSYKNTVADIAKQSGVTQPIHGRVAVSFLLFPQRPLNWERRARKSETWDDSVMCIDLDNAQKVLLDALKNVVFDDDKWVRRIYAERVEPDGDARIEVVIESMEEKE